MDVPEVDKKLLAELESLGFPTVRATRALHYSGNNSLENAVTWVVEHENDLDIDEMPKVPINKVEDAEQSLTSEEEQLKAPESRNWLKKRTACYSHYIMIAAAMKSGSACEKKGEEKSIEREREKERIRAAEELLNAKKTEEENERKCLVDFRKAEKKEEHRAQEKICQRIDDDKIFSIMQAERTPKFIPLSEDTSSTKATTLVRQEKKSSLPIKPSTKAEWMRDCLGSLKQTHKDDDAKVKRAFQTLLIYVGNVATNPDEKYRKIRLSNASFQDRVGSLKGGIEFLELCGFEKLEGGEFLFLPREKVDLTVLESACSELNFAIANSFFGVL